MDNRAACTVIKLDCDIVIRILQATVHILVDREKIDIVLDIHGDAILVFKLLERQAMNAYAGCPQNDAMLRIYQALHTDSDPFYFGGVGHLGERLVDNFMQQRISTSIEPYLLLVRSADATAS